MEKQVYRSRLRAKGQLTVPGPIRATLDLNEGDELIFSVTEQGTILIQPAQVIPADQAWFWTERWQKMEREAQADIEAGRVTRHQDMEAAIEALDAAADEGE